jgi:hypothetical protein
MSCQLASPSVPQRSQRPSTPARAASKHAVHAQTQILWRRTSTSYGNASLSVSIAPMCATSRRGSFRGRVIPTISLFTVCYRPASVCARPLPRSVIAMPTTTVIAPSAPRCVARAYRHAPLCWMLQLSPSSRTRSGVNHRCRTSRSWAPSAQSPSRGSVWPSSGRSCRPTAELTSRLHGLGGPFGGEHPVAPLASTAGRQDTTASSSYRPTACAGRASGAPCDTAILDRSRREV